VILQDEQLVVREIQRQMQRMAAARAVPVAMPAAAGVPAGVGAGVGGGSPYAPYGFNGAPDPAEVEPASEPDADESDGSLASVAKAASLKAERAAIEHTLRQVHWNRRKAAQNLGVSYKTLLNKIKECGISRV
jgi:DNA-binding NtrC family response regulator